MKPLRLLTLCCAAAFFATLSACGVTGPIIENPVLDELPQVRNDAALVYFFRLDSRTNSRYKRYLYVYDDYGDAEDFLGGVQAGTFFFVHVLSGTHNFSCLEIELEPGQTYYLEQNIATQSGILLTPSGNLRDPRINVDPKRLMRRAPIDLCPPKFVAVKPEYAQPIIESLTYTIVKKD